MLTPGAEMRTLVPYFEKVAFLSRRSVAATEMTFEYAAGYCGTDEFALPAAPIKVMFALAAAAIASCTQREGVFIPKLMLITCAPWLVALEIALVIVKTSARPLLSNTRSRM